MRTETKITYGFRDPKSARFIKLEIESNEGRDMCGAETVRFSTNPWDKDAPRYEVEDLRDLMATFSEDPHWFNSSRERPSWNGFNPASLLPAQYEAVLQFDSDLPGADPVSATHSALFMELPRRFEGPVHMTRDGTPEGVLLRAFGEAYAALERTVSAGGDDAIWSEVMLVDTSEAEAEAGMFLTTGNRNTGQIDAIVPVPEGWPQRRDIKVDLDAPGMRLALVRINHFVAPVSSTRPFQASDFKVKRDIEPSPG